MKGSPDLGKHIKTFFDDYLTRQRSLSPHTVLSYRDSLKLLLQYAAARHSTQVLWLTVEHLDSETVLAFLEHLEVQRTNSIATRNSRLAALRSFFRHVAARDPRRMELCQRVASIPAKRGPQPTVSYLEAPELKAILDGIDRTTPTGRRDHVLLSFMYQTGVRVQEAVDVRACDLQLDALPNVRIWGKGRRERIVPLWAKTAALLKAWLLERSIDLRAPSPVFVNAAGSPLSRWGVTYILAKHALSVSECGALAAKRVTPHTLRHTTAVHMLEAGVGTDAIRDLLGHASAATTWRYARLGMDMKRKAIEACVSQLDGSQPSVPVWRNDDDLLRELEAIGRPKYGKPKVG